MKLLKMLENKYIIKLPNGKKLLLWFIGDKLEVLMDAYNIEYEKVSNNETDNKNIR